MLLYAIAVITASSGRAAKPSNDALVGDWRGDSICVVRPSACVDEKALYHVKKLGQPDRYSVQADKIVNGQAIDMGTFDCEYASDKQALTCQLPKGVIHLALRGTRLEEP
jgi:hypothetical protein